MKVMVGICTYNRKEIFEKSINSLRCANHFDSVDVCVFDDCSTDYGIEYIKSVLPTAKVILSNENAGPGRNALKMYNYFLESNSDILINADSDLLYRKDIIDIVHKYIQKHCFFSLFNTESHPVICEYDDIFVEKANVGAAGCCMTKDIVRLIINNMEIINDYFDYEVCKILKSNGIKILSMKRSKVQHIGYYGYNSYNGKFDYGINYDVDSIEDAKVIISTLEQAYKLCREEATRSFGSRLLRNIRKD